MLKLYNELKRRKMFRTLVAYAAFAFVIIQVCSIVFPALLLPDWANRFVVILVILGFPVTVFFAWVYDITPEGVQKTPSVSTSDEDNNKSRKILLPLTGLLTIIGVVFWGWYGLGSFSQGSEVDNKIFKSIAVLYLNNFSSDPKNDNICAGLTTSITTAFHRLGRFKVKARTDVLKFRNKVTSHKEIRDILEVDAYIEGSLTKVPGKNRYIANIMLIDAEKGNNIWANEYNKTAEEISNISNTIASEVAQFLSGDKVEDFEVLNDSFGADGHDKSFSLMGEGINLLDSGEYNKSINVFDSILVNEPDNNRAIYSKGQALEKLGQYSEAISYYNQMLTVVSPIARTKNVFMDPYVLKNGVEDLDVYIPGLFYDKLNIQVRVSYRKDLKITEIYALNLKTRETIWKKTYPFMISDVDVVGENLVVTFSVVHGEGAEEAAVYVHSLEFGRLLYSREFTKDYPEQKVRLDILNNKGADISAFQGAVCLYVRRDDYYSLVLIDPKSNQTILEGVITVPGVSEGKPLIYLVEEGGDKFLFHKKGLNLYLFEIETGKLIWSKALLDDTYDIVVDNNVMLLYSDNETEVVLQNIVSQKHIEKFDLDYPMVRGFSWKENIIINAKNSIVSLKTYKPFLRSLHNWTQNIDKNEEIKHIFYIYDNLFTITKSGNLYCINGNTGKIINKNQIGYNIELWEYPEYNSDDNSPKSLILYAGGFLLGLDPHNGKTLWKIRELNIVKNWGAWGRIIPLGNKVIVLKKPKEKNNIIMKAYSRMTGELLWQTEEDILLGLKKWARSSRGDQYKIYDWVFGYSINNALYMASHPAGFIYNVDISWRPNKNYIPIANISNNLAYCYNKINNMEKAEEILNNIINVVDQQNELAFQQLSDLYLSNHDNLNYIKTQIGFHELVFYDDIKRGNIENQLVQTSGLKWVQYYNKNPDFAVQFPDKNITVVGVCDDGGGCSFKYYRTSSGILIGENNLDLNRFTNVMALNNRLVFVGEKESETGSRIYSLFTIDPHNQTVINKILLWDGCYNTRKIYNFGDLYIVDSDICSFTKTLPGEQLRNLIAIDIDGGSILWENNYEFSLLYRQRHVELVNKDNLIIVPLEEQLQNINMFTGKIEQVYNFDDFDGIKFLDQNSLNKDNLSFITTDDEFVIFNLITQKILFHGDEIYFDNMLNIAYLNHNSMLAYTYDGYGSKVILYENNGKDISWIKDFKGQIRILDVIDNTAYIHSLDGGTITTINFENPTTQQTNYLLWDSNKIIINTKSYGVLYKNGLYFINI